MGGRGSSNSGEVRALKNQCEMMNQSLNYTRTQMTELQRKADAARQRAEEELKALIARSEQKEQERIQKQAEAQNYYQQQSHKIKEKYLLGYSSTITEKVNQGIETEFQYYSFDDVKQIIVKLINEQLVEQSFKKYMLEITQNNSKQLSTSINHLNIVVLGKTGIGKSTLINSFLQLTGEQKAPTGVGGPASTGKPKLYHSEKCEKLRLYDTQGIELDNYNVEKLLGDLKELIDLQTKTDNLDKMIHAMWFCISCVGLRFEKSEENIMYKIQKYFANGTLPIIIVITQGYDEDDVSEMTKIIKKAQKININTIIPVVCQQKYNTQPYGMNELLKETAMRTPEAANSAYFHCLVGQLKTIISNLMINLPKQAKEKSLEIVEIDIYQSNELLTYENIIDKSHNILSTILIIMISIKENNAILTDRSLQLINELIEKYFLTMKKLVERFITIEMESIANELGLKLFDMMNSIEIERNVKLSNQLNFDQFKYSLLPEIRAVIQPDIINSFLKLSVGKICDLFIDTLHDDLNTLLNKIMKQIQPELLEISKEAMKSQTIKLIEKCGNN